MAFGYTRNNGLHAATFHSNEDISIEISADAFNWRKHIKYIEDADRKYLARLIIIIYGAFLAIQWNTPEKLSPQ